MLETADLVGFYMGDIAPSSGGARRSPHNEQHYYGGDMIVPTCMELVMHEYRD